MSIKEIKTTELAKELGIKATEVVKALEKLKEIQYKKGTTNLKLTPEDVEALRNYFKKEAPPPAEAKPVEEKLKVPEKKPSVPEKPLELKETAVEPQKKKEDVVLKEKPSIVADEEETKIPDRFKKEIEVEKVEKIKVKPTMQKAFQTIKKVEFKKFVEHKGFKKTGREKFKATEIVPQQPITAPRKKSIKLPEGLTVKEFAELIGHKVTEVIKKFMELGFMPTINQSIDIDAANIVADSFGIKVETVTAEHIDIIEDIKDDAATLVDRPPVVTIMGHVDHGKTSLLDAIRKTKVTETEAGGITQHIGAYKITLHGRDITFLDTPGHEAFTSMRARGAKATDIVVLVVAADDGVMPQTLEAIDHAKAANVPIIVAINKIDKPEANIQKVKNELAEQGVISEEWGGQNIFVEVSAKKNIGIEHLLEMILLRAEIMELKANPDRLARGPIIEARLDKSRGPIATILIQSGMLKTGDAIVAGTASGKVRALTDDTGKKINSAGPSTPVEVIGFSEVPSAGDMCIAVDDERKARQIALARVHKQRSADIQRRAKLTLDELYAKIKEGQIKDLNIIIKADVQGSVEAMKKALEGITHPDVHVKVLHTSVGGIKESDVMLASASNAIIIGFNIRPEPKAAQTAEKEGVDIRLYNVIYDAIEDVKKALEGLLQPTLKERILGRAEVRQTFQVSRLGTIAGCYVLDGILRRGSEGIRVIRDNIVVYEGRISSLKRFKEDVREVQTGYECGLTIENFNDVKIGDVLENYLIEKIAAKL